MLPKVSIITTYFNSVTLGDFVHKTMRFLRGQTYQNLELICVHDGSPDDTLKQLQEYAALDSRIVIIDKPNEGTAQYAKAAGQNAATGDFVMLMDHDDELSLGAVEKAVEAFTEHPGLDFVNFIVDVRFQDGKRKGLYSLDESLTDFADFRFKTISGREALEKTAGTWDVHLRGVYRTEIFKKESFRLSKKLLNADEIVERKLIKHMNLIGNCTGVYTHYVLPNSSAKTLNLKLLDILETDLYLRSFFKAENIYEKRKSQFEKTAYRNFIDGIKIYHKFRSGMSNMQEIFYRTLLQNAFDAIDRREVLKHFRGLAKVYNTLLTSNFNLLLAFYRLKAKISR